MPARSRVRSAGSECASPASALKLRRLLALFLVPDPTQPFRKVHRIFEAILGQQKPVEFLDLPTSQRSYGHVPFPAPSVATALNEWLQAHEVAFRHASES